MSLNTESENSLPHASPGQQYKGQEGENHSTAAEGTLKSSDELPDNFGSNKEGEEHDLDDVVHAGKEAGAEDGDFSQGGQATPLNKEEKFTSDDISS